MRVKEPQTTSLYSTKVQINAYLPLLPASVIEELHSIHPIVPLFAMLIEVSIFLGVLYMVSGIGNEEIIGIRRRRNFAKRGIAKVFRKGLFSIIITFALASLILVGSSGTFVSFESIERS